MNAGNVLVLEDNEPAAKWLSLINQSLNGPSGFASYNGLKPTASFGGSLLFPKPSLKKIKKTFKKLNGKRLKSCNCVLEMERKAAKDFCFRCQESNFNLDDSSTEEEDDSFPISVALATNQMKYSLVTCKQMVGIFVSVWMKKELIQHVGHLRICCTSRGIMGCLGNKVVEIRFFFFTFSFDASAYELRSINEKQFFNIKVLPCFSYMAAGVYISEHVILSDKFLLYLQSSSFRRERGR